MKYVFGINAESQSAKIDGYNFVERRVDYDLYKKQDECHYKIEEYHQKAFPKTLRLVKNACFYLFLVFLFFTSLFFIVKRDNYLLAFIFASLTVLTLIIQLFITVRIRVNSKKIAQSEEFKAVVKESDNVYEQSILALNIPQDSIFIDVLLYTYRLNNVGEYVSASPVFDFVNFGARLFVENNKLMISDSEAVLSFDLNTIKGVNKVDKKAKVYGWNKDIPYTDETFKNQGVCFMNGSIVLKYYYEIVVDYLGEEYAILFAPYEYSAVMKLIKPEEN